MVARPRSRCHGSITASAFTPCGPSISTWLTGRLRTLPLASWVAPCPIGNEEISRRKDKQHRKSRMDARTSAFAGATGYGDAADRRRQDATEILLPTTTIGQPFTAAGGAPWCVSTALRRCGQDLGPGRRRNRHDLVKEEDHAWSAPSSRCCGRPGSASKSWTELPHHSLVHHRQRPLVKSCSCCRSRCRKAGRRATPVVSPELAEVLSAIISVRTQRRHTCGCRL